MTFPGINLASPIASFNFHGVVSARKEIYIYIYIYIYISELSTKGTLSISKIPDQVIQFGWKYTPHIRKTTKL